MAKPSNSKLYNSIKAQAKSKFSVYPSAYASAWIVKQYKKRGSYSGKKTSGIKRAAKRIAREQK